MGQATVLLVDDNPDFLRLAQHTLEPHFRVVGAFCAAEPALRAALSLRPEIILLDVSLGEMNGFEVVRRLQSMGCSAKPVFYSVHEDVEFVRAAISIGAFGYVFKSRTRRDLVQALAEVRMGGTYFPPTDR